MAIVFVQNRWTLIPKQYLSEARTMSISLWQTVIFSDLSSHFCCYELFKDEETGEFQRILFT